MSDRRQRASAIGLLILGAVVLWITVGQPWAQVPATNLDSATLMREIPGRDIAPGAVAAGSVGAAGIAAVAATRGRWRSLVGWILAVVGALGVASVVTASAGWSAARVSALVGCAAIAIAGVVVGLRGAHWAGLSQRYERAPVDGGPRAAWDALDRGEDPTA